MSNRDKMLPRLVASAGKDLDRLMWVAAALGVAALLDGAGLSPAAVTDPPTAIPEHVSAGSPGAMGQTRGEHTA